jgi:hypothetical protein
VLPGRLISFPVGFGVRDPKDLLLEVAPGFDYESALFTNS